MLVTDNLYEEPQYIVMADDGKGGSVNIPSMLISKLNGDKLKKSIHDGESEEDSQDLEDDEDETFITPDKPDTDTETKNHTSKGK